MATVVEYIKPCRYDSELFKIIKVDHTKKHLLKIHKRKPCDLLFIKSYKLNGCVLERNKKYDLKVEKIRSESNRPVLKYQLEEKVEACTIDFSSDSD